MSFHLTSPYQPAGDQPEAIAKLVTGITTEQKLHQTLLGVTGSGKTFTMANVIQKTGLPTLVIAHNKTLAGQLYQEFRDFFPENAVSYFVSYYDYYQPEAYMPATDTYIEKEATINDEIDKLRLATTTNLLTRRDCIVVASVSCIYNLGSPVEFGRSTLEMMEGELIARETLLLQLQNLQYQRSETDLLRGTYRLRGDTIQIWPASESTALQIETLENRITRIQHIDPITGSMIPTHPTIREAGQAPAPKRFVLYPAKHYVANPNIQTAALAQIEQDLQARLREFRAAGKVVEAYRLEQKVHYDVDMIRELGFVNGIENYSRYFDGRQPGDPPYTLIDYFHENARIFHLPTFLTIIDESHMTIPQVRGMHNGDQARKQTLIEYGFRLPSALDNRPLKFVEFMGRMKTMLFVSATPNPWEVSLSGNEVVEQLIRPTGLVDPSIELRTTKGQIEDLIIEIIQRKQHGQRTLVTTLTKKMAESLTDYLNDPEKIRKLIQQHQQHTLDRSEQLHSESIVRKEDELPVEQMTIGPIQEEFYTYAQLNANITSNLPIEALPKVAYLHSDIQTLERSDILDDLRRGEYDVLVGINLLREGLDLPEVTLVAILDADKEGFLRSETSLIQTMGRAARHQEGHVIMYADRLTQSMQKAIGETRRRRAVQIRFNTEHGITAQTIYKPIRERMIAKVEESSHATYSANSHGRKNAPVPKQLLIQLSKHEEIDVLQIDVNALTPVEKNRLITKLKRRMKQAINEMDFELAAILRDVLKKLTV